MYATVFFPSNPSIHNSSFGTPSLTPQITSGPGISPLFFNVTCSIFSSFLTEEKKDFISIIAGYKDDLKNCFFSYNDMLIFSSSLLFTLIKSAIKAIKKV